jgi:hypothetical protein
VGPRERRQCVASVNRAWRRRLIARFMHDSTTRNIQRRATANLRIVNCVGENLSTISVRRKYESTPQERNAMQVVGNQGHP